MFFQCTLIVLWSGAPNSARGAKVSWEEVCTPKESGGLGLHRLSGLNIILRLKSLWRLFQGSDSLWVAWVKKHYLEDKIFWLHDFSTMGSLIWRGLMNLRTQARPFILCHVNSGSAASFWHDDWTNLGPLFDITGPTGPSVSAISLDATVSLVYL